MTKKNIVTVGQIYTLLFISRISLVIIYSVFVSGISSIWSFLLPLIVSMAISILMIIPVNVFYGKSRRKSVCRISVEQFGKMGYTIPILYAMYFLLSCLYAVKALEHFLDIMLPDDINSKVVLSVLMIACIYAAVKGIEALSRMSAIVLGFIFLSGALLLIYLIQGFSSENMIPFEYASFSGVIDGTVFIISRMNTSAALNVLIPSTRGRLWKSGIIWSVTVFLFMIFMLVLFRGAIGDYLDSRELGVYQAIEGAGSLQRLNPFFIFVTMCSTFCNISVLLFALSESVKTIFMDGFGKIISVTGGVILLLAVLLVPETEILFNKYIWCVLTVVFTAVVPSVVYIFTKTPQPKISRRVVRTASMTIIISLVMIIFSGCNSTQLNQRLIVQGMGIDKNNEGYYITLIVLDTENEEKENAIKLMYTDGENVDEALCRIENQRGKKLLLSQCLFIMMNGEASRNYERTLSYFSDLSGMQKTSNLMVTESSAKSTLSTAVEKLGYQSEYINVLADSKAISQTEVHCSLIDYISSLKSAKALLFPNIVIKDDISALSVEGSFLADRNGNYFSMTSDETLGTLIINQKVNDFTDTVGEASYKIKRIKSNINPVWKNGFFDISFDIEVYLDKSYEKDVLNDIKENILGKVNAGIEKTVLQTGSDVFSIGKYIRSAYPEVYKNGNVEEFLKNAVTHTKITCRI